MTQITIKAVLNFIPVELADLEPNGKDKKPGLRYKNKEFCSSVQLVNREKKEYIIRSFASSDIFDNISKGDVFSLLGGRNSELARGEVIEVLEIKED